MKIVDVAEYYAEGGGGIKTYIQAKMRAAEARGHELVVIAPGREDREEARYGGRILWVKGPAMPFDDRYGVLWNRRAVHRLLDREAPDVVEASSAWFGGNFVATWPGDALKTLIFHQDPVAVVFHTAFDRLLSRGLIDKICWPLWAHLRRLSARFDATVVAGEWLQSRLDSFSLHNPLAVPFGIDKAVFSPQKAREEKRGELLERCGLSAEAPLLLIVSRFHPEKRLGTLFRAFRRAKAQRPMGLIVYGAGYLSGRLRRLAEETPGLILAGYTKDREELAEIYASSDLLLHGSAAETYGLGVAEALCSGLPVVSPSVGGAADLVRDGEAGYHYPPGDIEACAETVERVLADRPQLAAGCALAAKRISTVDQHFERLFTLYEARLAARS